MALNVKSGNFDLNNSTGNQSVTGVGFQPKLVLFLSANTGTTLPTYQAGMRYVVGAMADDGTECSWANNSDDNQTKSNTSRQTIDDACLELVSAGGGVNSRAEYVSMDSDGFTINVTTAHADVNTVMYLAIGGLVDVTIGSFLDGAGITGNLSITGVGFKPDALFTLGGMQTTLNTAMNNCYGSFGFTDGTREFCSSIRDHDNQNPSSVERYASDSHIYCGLSGPSIKAKFSFVSFDSDGFTINREVNSAVQSRNWLYIALKGVKAYVDVETTPASTGTQSYSSYGFEPEALVGILSFVDTLDSPAANQDCLLAFGFSDGVTDGGVHGGNKDSVSPTETVKSASDVDLFYAGNTAASAVEMEVVVDSFDSDGLTLDFQTNSWGSGRYFGLFTLADARIHPTGIASTLAFGSHTIGTGQTIEPNGIASTLAFGTHKLILDVTPNGIASTLAFGTHIVSTVQTISPNGIASTLTFGTHKLILDISFSGIASTSAFGTHILTLDIAPDGIASTSAFGSHTITEGLTIAPDGIASTLAFGTHTITPNSIINPNGIASTAVFGTHTLILNITSVGIASTLAFGTHTLTHIIFPTGIASTLATGTHSLTLDITPNSISSTFNSGTHILTHIIMPTGIASTLAFGTHIITTGAINIQPSSIASTLDLGDHVITGGDVIVITMEGIASTLGLGHHIVDYLSTEFLMNTYLTPFEMDSYLLGVIDTEPWDAASLDQRKKALVMATRAIDRLDFQGEKAVSTQTLEFPRGDDIEVPQDIKDATGALALVFLDGVDPEIENDLLRTQIQSYAGAKTTYDATYTPDHIRSGIPSVTAWNYLKPYLRDIEQMELSRTQ